MKHIGISYIWFANFPYEEDATITKKRPVIILNVEPLEVLSVKVTSKDVRDADKYDTPIQHWSEAGLDKPSIARISKTMFLDKRHLLKGVFFCLRYIESC